MKIFNNSNKPPKVKEEWVDPMVYKKEYKIFIEEYFDDLPEESRIGLDKKLQKLGL